MENLDENKPIYASEDETIVFRLKDFIQTIERHIQLPVTEILVMGKDHYPEWRAAETEIQPDRAWFFQVTFHTPEGDKEAEVNVGLKENKLRVYAHSRPTLKIFKEKDRERAKESVPDLTLDYIGQLEQVGVSAWLLWKQLYEYVNVDPKLVGLKGPMRMFRDEYRKV